MPAAIPADLLFSALIVVALFLIILSTPTIILAVRASAKLLARYRILRSVDDLEEGSVSKQMMDEWSTVNSPLNYTALLSDEIERLGTLRQAMLHSEIAIVMLIVMAFYPGYENDVLIAVAIVVALVALVVVYGIWNLRRYVHEYVEALTEINVSGDEAVSRIYG
ncbi:MAG: hypothetical protein LBH69_03325 [Methanomassiliicoccaceae archaeon]|jgi:hypothetical protein|nr:hypothetical protein [Methanomassiliicoccaceae archaeon]